MAQTIRQGRRPRPGRAGLVLLLLSFTASAGAMDAQRFAQQLELAQRLNIEAPWPESQAVLDELRPHLDLASDEQFVTFLMLESRNQALNGEIDASLATMDTLLSLELDPPRRLAAHARAANVGYIGRRFETTFHHLNAAFELVEAPGVTRGLSQVYSIAAYMYSLVEEYEDAREFGQQAVAIAREQGRVRELCAGHERLAFVHKRAGEFEAAQRNYLEGLATCPLDEHPVIAGALENGLADLLQAAGRFDEARPRFERGMATMERMNYRNGLAEARVFRARMAIREGDAALTEQLLNAALPDLVAAGHDEYIAEAHQRLAELHHRQARFPEAFDHLQAAMTAREAHLDGVRARQAAFLRTQFATAVKERELIQLRERQRIAELEAQSEAQRAQLRILVAIAGGLLMIILVVLLRRAVRDRRRYRRLAERDALTALSNHTRFFELAERMMALCREKRRSFLLVLADIDHFKDVNDRYGHPVGDQVLKKVAERMRENLGAIGILGRIGGEEFAMALPDVEPAQLRRRLDRLRHDLVDVKVEDLRVPITMSFGVAGPEGDESLALLRARADQRLYAAKQAGRDRIIDQEPAA